MNFSLVQVLKEGRLNLNKTRKTEMFVIKHYFMLNLSLNNLVQDKKMIRDILDHCLYHLSYLLFIRAGQL